MATKDNISSPEDDIKAYKISLPTNDTSQATVGIVATTTTSKTLANNTDETNKVQGTITQVSSSSLIKKQNLIPVTLANNRKLTIFKNTVSN